MTGGGFRSFTAGEVLTAANVQDFFMDQAVMNFAGTAARASAIPTPSAGMVTHIGGGTVQVYNGTAWVALGGVPNAVLSNTPTGNYTSGGTTYNYYTFTASGTATVTTAGFANVLVISGGGGGGSGNSEQVGAGGGGGMTEQTLLLEAGSYTVTVGGGGAAGSNGGLSRLGNILSTSGGGRGASARGAAGANGGSGGGGGDHGGAGGSGASMLSVFGATLATPQGNNGSAGGNDVPSPTTDGGSGGGAGGNASGNTAGVGRSSSITGSAVTYAAGARVQDGNGGANTARGGGQNGSGGSGVVVVRVKV